MSDAVPKRSGAFEQTHRRCYICKRTLPLASFRTITTTSDGGRYRYVTPSHDCRECNKEYKRQQRRRKAEAAGKVFVPRGDRAAWEAQQRAAREAIVVQRQTQQQLRIAERAKRTEDLRSAATLQCRTCNETKARSDFVPHSLRDVPQCRACFRTAEAASFQRQKNALTSNFVKKQIVKHSRLLKMRDIPQSLVEAKRAQLLIQRVVTPRKAQRP